MELPLLKSALWTLAGFMLHYCTTPPHRRVSKEDKLKNENLFNKTYIHYGLRFNRFLTWCLTLAEILTVQSSSFRRITSFPSSSKAASVDAPFLASFILLAVSFFIRVRCYRTLGDLFTVELTIRPDHKLITNGPYRFVRHPSYSSLVGIFIGNTMLHLSMAKSWAVKWALWVWLAYAFAGCLQIWTRSKEEDALLWKRFGAEWVAYRMRVPYLLIPGLL